MYNSTIRAKSGHCSRPGCNYKGPLTKGQCPVHYWTAVKMRSVSRLEEKELIENESLSSVVEDLDAVFSQYIRLRDSDENGYITCYCGAVVFWTEADNSHFMPRARMNTRFSEDNCNGSCRNCNQSLRGNLKIYGAWLENKRPGSVEALEDQAAATYKYDIPELKGLIAYYSKEVRHLKKLKPMKL